MLSIFFEFEVLDCREYFSLMSVDVNQETTTLYNLKVVSATFLLVCFLSLNKSTCKTRKNVFYFTSKALFVLKKIKFLNSAFLNFMPSSNAKA